MHLEALSSYPTAGCLGGEPGPDLVTSSFQTSLAFAFSAAAALLLPGCLTHQPHGLLHPPGTDHGCYLQTALLRDQRGEETPRSEPGPATAGRPSRGRHHRLPSPQHPGAAREEGMLFVRHDARSCRRHRAATQAVTLQRRGLGSSSPGPASPGVCPTHPGQRRHHTRALPPPSARRGRSRAPRHHRGDRGAASCALRASHAASRSASRFSLPAPLPAASRAMLTSRTFVKRTRAGAVVKVVREHYLRDDIACGAAACRLCPRAAPGGGSAPGLEARPGGPGSSLCPGPHFLLPDTNLLLHQVSAAGGTEGRRVSALGEARRCLWARPGSMRRLQPSRAVLVDPCGCRFPCGFRLEGRVWQRSAGLVPPVCPVAAWSLPGSFFLLCLALSFSASS